MGFGGKSQHITFEPGLEAEFTWQLITTSSITRNYSVSAQGDLAEYVTIEPEISLLNVKPGVNPEIKVYLNLPEERPSPGIHTIDITMRELPNSEEKEQGIYALSGAIPRIYVNVLYEGKKLEAEMNVEDVNKGEMIAPVLDIHNYGLEDISGIGSEFVLYNGQEEVKSVKKSIGPLKSDERKEIGVGISSEGLEGGEYILKSNLSWDGQNTLLQDNLRIGDMDLDIINTTKELYKDSINEFNIDIESRWNGEIKGVYAEIDIGGKTAKTASYNLKAWNNLRLSGYMNTEGLEEGLHEAKVTLYYGSKTKSKDLNVLIKGKESNGVNSTVLLIGALSFMVVLLIGLNLMILMKKEKKDDKKKRKKK